MSRTCVRGDATEALVRSELLRAGLTVLEPIGTRHAFDLVVLADDQKVFRIQCKTARPRGDCLLFNSCSTDHGAGRRDYSGRADVFGVGDLESREVYIVPVVSAGTRSTSLRLKPTRNGQQAGILFAGHHTVAAWVATIE